MSAGRPGTGESRGVGRRTLPLEKSRFQEHFAQCRADLFAPGDGAAELVWKTAIPGARKTGHLEERFRHSRPAPC